MAKVIDLAGHQKNKESEVIKMINVGRNFRISKNNFIISTCKITSITL